MLLHVLDFTSERKRMSVIVRDLQNQKILLLTKGADSIIADLLNQKSEANKLAHVLQHVDTYARAGLRTLLLAKREIDEQVYQQWEQQYFEAESSIEDREMKIEVMASQIEQELQLIGSTAIEDQLQDGVAETIQTLRASG